MTREAWEGGVWPSSVAAASGMGPPGPWSAGDGLAGPGWDGTPGAGAGAGGGAGGFGGGVVVAGRRVEGVRVLVEGLRGALGGGVSGGVLVAAEGALVAGVPVAGVVEGEELVGWLRRLMGVAVGSAEWEGVLAARMGPELFGLGGVPAAPGFVVGVDQLGLGAGLVAPLLRRLSLTRGVPSRGELAVGVLAGEAGVVARVRRGVRARRWGQPVKSGAPLLAEVTEVPHVVHGIWLGGPLPAGGRFAVNFGVAARRYAGVLDFVVWTDVPRWRCEAADAGAGGDGDGLGAVREMLAWARREGICLVNVFEVFHAGAPMLLQAQFAAEMAKQLPRGYSGASDLLRLEVIYRFGGLYTDGDNLPSAAAPQPGTDVPGGPPCDGLPGLIAEVAAATLGFTLHVLPPGHGVNNDVLIAPARHPAVRLCMETARLRYPASEPELYGGVMRMSRHYVGTGEVLLRHSVVHRTGRSHHWARMLLGLSLEDDRLVRVDGALGLGGEHTWSRDVVVGAGVVLGGEVVVARVARVVAVLARQLVSREGDLHLTAVAAVVASLPDPGAVWVAVLGMVAELAEAGVVPEVRSVTWFRWADDGAPELVVLPPEALELVEPVTAAAGGWLGAGVAAVGEPAWLLDEAVVAARLRVRAVPGGRRAALRALTQVVAGGGGGVAGVRIGVAGRPGAGGPVVPAGYVLVEVAGRVGLPWAGPHPLAPEDVALLLGELGLAGRPVLLADRATPGPGPTLGAWATYLATLLHQPVLTTGP
jgi:hypothetical protein